MNRRVGIILMLLCVFLGCCQFFSGEGVRKRTEIKGMIVESKVCNRWKEHASKVETLISVIDAASDNEYYIGIKNKGLQRGKIERLRKTKNLLWLLYDSGVIFTVECSFWDDRGKPKRTGENKKKCETTRYQISLGRVTDIIIRDSDVFLSLDNGKSYRAEKNESGRNLFIEEVKFINSSSDKGVENTRGRIESCRNDLRKRFNKYVGSDSVYREDNYCCYFGSASMMCFYPIDMLCLEGSMVVAMNRRTTTLEGVSITASSEDWCDIEIVE